MKRSLTGGGTPGYAVGPAGRSEPIGWRINPDYLVIPQQPQYLKETPTKRTMVLKERT